MVLYYQLPELKEGELVTMEIKNEAGELVRKFSSKADPSYKGGYDGAAPRDPLLSTKKGINRFVWNMRYPTTPGIPGVYIESSFRGHKAIPGKYTVTVVASNQQATTTATILANPLYNNTPADYKEFNEVMILMEKEVTVMHTMINSLHASTQQLQSMLKNLPNDAKYATVKVEGEALVKKLTAWDEDMVQRKSTAYDDVENFPNKFTANYLFLLNQTESEIARVNQPNLDLLKEYTAEWDKLKARGVALRDVNIPALNKMLWEAGIGAVQ